MNRSVSEAVSERSRVVRPYATSSVPVIDGWISQWNPIASVRSTVTVTLLARRDGLVDGVVVQREGVIDRVGVRDRDVGGASRHREGRRLEREIDDADRGPARRDVAWLRVGSALGDSSPLSLEHDPARSVSAISAMNDIASRVRASSMSSPPIGSLRRLRDRRPDGAARGTLPKRGRLSESPVTEGLCGYAASDVADRQDAVEPSLRRGRHHGIVHRLYRVHRRLPLPRPRLRGRPSRAAPGGGARPVLPR